MDFFNETFLKYTILLFMWIEYFWELILSIRQHMVVGSTEEVPKELRDVMTKDTFDKARMYTLARSRFDFFRDTFSILVSTAVIYDEILAIVWNFSESIDWYEGEVFTSCVWLLTLSTLSTVINLPFSIYYTFVLEEAFGFNKQTVKFFVWDKIKGFILTQVLTMMIASIIIVVVKNGGDYFFVWLWFIVCILSLVLLTVYPSLIAPLFDKYTPLPEGPLRTEIESLAADLKFPLTQLYIVEGSKRSSHSNAYFYGLFKSKRIVLFDTLLAKEDGSGCKDDEILAVLSHELGHWKLNHVAKNIVLMQLNLFLLFAGFAYMFKYPPVYQALGFYDAQPILVGLLVVVQYVLLPYNTLLTFFVTCLSRKFEFQADAFAVELGKADPLKRALIQLNKDNLGFPIFDSLYSAWHHSHPPLLERFAAMDAKVKKD